MEVVTSNSGASDNDQFTLPFILTGTYNCLVKWGDGNEDTITIYNEAATQHTYSSSGTYTIKISGTIQGFSFGTTTNDQDPAKVTEISQWGTLQPTSVNGTFQSCSNMDITASDAPDLSQTTTMNTFFNGCSSFDGLSTDMSTWDVSGIGDFTSCFFQASTFNGDITAWTTTAAFTMSGMFRSSSFNRDISGWDMNGVTSVSNMFNGVGSFNQNLAAWDTSTITNMQSLFRSTSMDQNLAAWDVTGVTNMVLIFDSTPLSQANYDAILIGWEAQAVQNSVVANFGNANYTAAPSAAATARAALIADHSWTITDGGPI